MTQNATAFQGVLCVNKPQKFTSFDVIAKLRGMTRSEFSRKSGLSPHTARNLMGYRELYGNPRMDTMVDAARALNAVVTSTPKGVTIRARKESA